MSISSNKKLKVDSVVDLSSEQERGIVKEDSIAKKESSKVGHLYPEENTPQYGWFKGSRDRVGRGGIAA